MTEEQVFKRRVSTRDPRWHDRAVTITSFGDGTAEQTVFPVADDDVLCNGCNSNIHDPDKPSFGWLIYFSKESVWLDQPYDVYCDHCTEHRFPDAVEVKP